MSDMTGEYWKLIVLAIVSVAVLVAATSHAPSHPELVEQLRWGRVRPKMTCPYCGSTGTVHCGQAQPWRNFGEGKAWLMALSGVWLAMAVKGLRKGGKMEAHCTQCGKTWDCQSASDAH